MALTHSESIVELAAALAKAQAEIEGAAKTKQNPHFRNDYPDLASVWDAVREPLTKHGLSVVQSPSSEGLRISVETVLLHASGQWMRDTMTVTAKDEGPQAAGSCITYLRRYALQAFAGVAPEDDDAEKGEGRKRPEKQPALPLPKPDKYDQNLADLETLAADNFKHARDAFKLWTQEQREYFMSVDKPKFEAFQAKGKAWDAAKRGREVA